MYLKKGFMYLLLNLIDLKDSSLIVINKKLEE